MVKVINELQWLASKVVLKFTLYGPSLRSFQANLHDDIPIFQILLSYLCVLLF